MVARVVRMKDQVMGGVKKGECLERNGGTEMMRCFSGSERAATGRVNEVLQ